MPLLGDGTHGYERSGQALFALSPKADLRRYFQAPPPASAHCNEREIDTAFATMAQQQIRALVIGSNTFFYARRDQIFSLAARNGIASWWPNGIWQQPIAWWASMSAAFSKAKSPPTYRSYSRPSTAVLSITDEVIE